MRRVGLLALAATLRAATPEAAPATHVVQLTGNRFAPAETRARVGDTVRFVNGIGGPHNVQFVAESIAGPARVTLARAMGGAKIGPLSSPLLLDPEERYVIVVPAVREGRYAFECLPHAATMRGALVVAP